MSTGELTIGSYIGQMLTAAVPLLMVGFAVWLLLWPASVQRFYARLYGLMGSGVDLPRPLFIRLVGFTWLALLAWFTWVEGR